MKFLRVNVLFSAFVVALTLSSVKATSQTAEPISNSDAIASIVRLDPGLDTVLAPGTKIERIASGFTFTEGPMWREGRLWFSDVRGDKLRAVDADGKVELLLDNPGGVKNKTPGMDQGSGGMAPDKDGKVLVCLQGGRTVVRLDDRMHETVVFDSWHGKKLNSPNDIVFAPDGSFWFTDPPYGLKGMDKSSDKELPFNAVFRYAHNQLTPIITDLAFPNGIGFSPDGKTLYVSNSGPQMFVKAYDVQSNGDLSEGRVFLSYPDHASGRGIPDGLKVDTAGNVWTTGPGGIRIVTPQGKILGLIRLPEVAANLGFAEDGKTVYITASTSIYRLHTSIPGEMPLYSAIVPQ